jgi:CRISPR type III-B/RAMP module-associated protein Cmr5
MDKKVPDHERAQAALTAVRALRGEPEQARRYKPYVNAFPALILGAGLGQAVATYMAAAGRGGGQAESYQAILRQLESWLCRECRWSLYLEAVAGEPASTSKSHGERLLMRIIRGNRNQLRAGTTEALAYVAWLKKLANALIKDEAAPASDPGNGAKLDEPAR